MTLFCSVKVYTSVLGWSTPLSGISLISKKLEFVGVTALFRSGSRIFDWGGRKEKKIAERSEEQTFWGIFVKNSKFNTKNIYFFGF